MSPLVSINSTTIRSLEGMLHFGWSPKKEGEVVKIAQIEGMAHLIILEPEESWLINHMRDLET